MEIKHNYGSPRWTQEILDCSMPMTFDTYNKCSYNCLYCFSYFQKSHSMGKGGTRIAGRRLEYQTGTNITSVNPEKIKKMFHGESNSQFNPYIKARKVFQWGGLADQFDEHERKHGITLELLRFFKSINYPICFSTKAVWWVYDKRYIDLFNGQDNWNVKFSIINLNPDQSGAMERGCPSPQERLKAMKVVSKLNKGGVTLRLRPFIIGLTNANDEYLDLIKKAKENGASAVSTEFLCLEGRCNDNLKRRYQAMSQVCRYDMLSFYREHSKSGYMRLNRDIKRPYIIKMADLCDKLGLRFYVSDAHFKEYCHNGSCCGLPETWNYSRGQFCQALMIAKEKGQVRFTDIKQEIKNLHGGYLYHKASGFNTNSFENRVKFNSYTMYDYIRYHWNTPKSGKSPYKYFGGILKPMGLDKDKDVIYKYCPE